MTVQDYLPYLDPIDRERDRMVDLLIRWAGINSYSRNAEGLERMLAALQEEFAGLNAYMQALDLGIEKTVSAQGTIREAPLGRALAVKKRRPGKLRVLLCVHMDTVYQDGRGFQECTRIDLERLRGPGVADAKGGILVMLKALAAFENTPWADSLDWEVLVTSDEELGSPGSAGLLTDAAKRCDLGLVFEPSLPDGSLVGARKGSGNFTAVVRGRSAHAGRSPELGRNAINALAEFIVALNLMHAGSDGVSVNVGWIQGGGAVNVVPDLATCRFNVRVVTEHDRKTFDTNLDRIVANINQQEGVSLEVAGGFARPPRPVEPRMLALLQHLAVCGRELGMKIRWLPSGGACDGNNLAAAGLPTVDSLGVRGGDLHSPNEYVFINSLTERAKLSALLLMKLASGEIIAPGPGGDP
jgi:glutamate carboxypeptidase